MAKADKAAAGTAPDSGAAADAVEVIDFNGLKIRTDAEFVSPGCTRHVEIGEGQVFMFRADEARQLPVYAIMPCLMQGIQLVK